MFAQISFQLAQKVFAGGAIFRALHGVRKDSSEIVTSDEKVAGETAPVLQRIARSFCELERFALAFRHLGCVDDGGGHRLFGLRAGFLSDLFFRRFERAFHIM